MEYYGNEAESVIIMRRRLFCFILCVITGLILLFQFQFQYGNSSNCQIKNTVRFTSGTIIDVESKDSDFFNFTIDTGGKKILASYYQSLRNPWDLIGAEIEFSGDVLMPEERGNPRTFDYRCYLLSRGITYTCKLESFTVKENDCSPYYIVKRYILEKREAFFNDLVISDTATGILRGLLFGDKSQMDEDVYDAFRKNGTAHVLAVSGLHVGILYGIYRWMHERWKCKWLTAGFLGFLFLYGTAALWSASVMRAIGLIVLVLLGKAVDRRYDLLSALSAMALFAMMRNPYMILNAGFQMSFLAVLSITFLQRPFRKYVGEKWAVAFAVQVGLLPYMAYSFNYISFVGVLCNVPIIFLTSILVPLGMAGFIWYLISSTVIPGFSIVMETVTDLMIWCNNLFSADGILSFDVVSPPLWLVLLFYGLLFFCASEYFHIYFYRKDWRKILVAFLGIMAVAVMGMMIDQTPFDQAELVFVDVGQGDCLHMKTPDGRNVLIDGGGKFGYNTGEKILKPYLLKNRIREIDLAAATHLHLDHYAGLKELAESYPVRQMMIVGQAGQKVLLENDYWLELLWPKEKNPDTEDENENSLIFMIHHDGLKTLITGDITAEGEELLLDYYKGTKKLQADILKIAHHGSPYSTSEAFVEAVNPKVAVISVGKNNYGHPSENVIEKLEENGIMVFRTDLDGAVGILNRKGILSICTEKQR